MSAANMPGIAPDAREGASTASGRMGAHSDAPGASEAPEAGRRPDEGDGRRATPRRALQLARETALAIEAAGGQMAAAVDRMLKATARGCDKAEREEVYIREWREITLCLEEHGKAMLLFLGGFMNASCFSRIAEAAHRRDIEERKTAMIAEMQAEEKRKQPEPGEGE